MIELADVYRTRNSERILFDLLKERDPEVNISHQKMPTFEEHEAFVNSKPYFVWYLIKVWGPYVTSYKPIVGSIYLTHNREVGIFIFKAYQGKGFGEAAVTELKNRVGGRLLANINPANKKSIQFFEKLGAKLIQNTYEIT